MDDLLETIIQNLYRVFGFDQGVVVAIDHFRNEYLLHFGRPNPRLHSVGGALR